jgi:hypothetical protein
MSLLSVIRRVSVLVGLRRPNVVATAPDASHASQMAEFARVEAETLAGRHDWSGITVPGHRFTTSGAALQYGALPDDFARFTFAGGIYGPWGRINGPLQKTDWSRITAYPHVAGSLNGSFRQTARGVEIYPTAPAGQPMRFDYVSKNLYADKDGNPKPEWSADTDVCLIPERLIELGVKWRWLQFKGFDYGEAMKDAEIAFEQLAGSDNGGRGILKAGRARLNAQEYAYPAVLGPKP